MRIVSCKDAGTQRRDLLYSIASRDDHFRMVTIATFAKVEEAHLLRMRLEAAGISAYLRDENMNQMWGYSLDLGGVRVEVAEENEEAARALVAAEPEGEE